MPAGRFAPPLLWRLAFFGCLAAVLALSLAKQASLPLDTGWDKSNHLLAFTVLTFLGLQSFSSRPVRVPVGLLLYGLLIEALQSLTDYRVAEYRDLLADLLGIALGSLIGIGWLRRRHRERQSGA